MTGQGGWVTGSSWQVPRVTLAPFVGTSPVGCGVTGIGAKPARGVLSGDALASCVGVSGGVESTV